jgi:hypothetical protein
MDKRRKGLALFVLVVFALAVTLSDGMIALAAIVMLPTVFGLIWKGR